MDRRARIAVVASLWLGALVAGFYVLDGYAATPGNPGLPVAVWPGASNLPRATDRDTLVVVVHAYCPCSRATITELGEIVGRVGDALLVHVVVVVPAHAAGDPLQSAIALSAKALPGVRVTVDRDHREADLFGARTSGHAVLYDARGRSLFAGGITGARGHAGRNEGRASILALMGGEPGSAHTPVYGCPTTRGPG